MNTIRPPDQLLAEDDSRDSLPQLQRDSSSPSRPNDAFLSILSAYPGLSLPPGPSSPLLDSPDRLRLFLDDALPLRSPHAEAFLARLKRRCADPAELRRMMVATLPRSSSRSAEGSSALTPFHGRQESLLQVLLRCLALQAPLVRWLLESLATEGEEWLAVDGVPSTASSLPPSSLCRLALVQLRYLDAVYDWEALCGCVREVIDSCPLPVQRDLIATLPEIIDPLYHPPIAAHLISALIPAHPELLLPILYALSSMSLPPALTHTVVESVCAKLGATDVKDLPVSVRFLLRAADEGNVDRVVAVMRKEITLLGAGEGRGGGGGKGSKNEREEVESGPVLIVRAIRSGLQSGSLVSKAYLATVEALSAPSDHAPIDVVLLIVLSHLSHGDRLARRAESILLKKVAAESITSALLRSVIAQHSASIHSMFDCVARLAETMVRHSDSRVRTVGGDMQVALFHAFPSNQERRKVVEHLLQHLGSRRTDEMSSALRSLHAIAAQDKAALKAFYTFLKTTLQYLDDYTLHHVRDLFHVLALLAVDVTAAAHERASQHAEMANAGLVEPTLMIFIRKELWASSFRDQRIGIVGVIALLQQLAVIDRPRSTPSPFLASQHDSGYRNALPAALCSEVEKLFDLMHDPTRHSPSALSFLYDEFSHAIAVHALHPDLLATMWSRYCTRFEPLLTIDTEHQSTSREDQVTRAIELTNADDLRSAILHSINKDDADSGCTVAVDILPALSRSRADDAHQVYMLASEVRLMAAAEISRHGHLASMEALLVAPVVMLKLDGERADDRLHEFKALGDRCQLLVVSAMLHCVNWWRELLNAWTSVERLSREDTARLLQRLAHVMDMEAELKAFVNVLRAFAPTDLLGMGNTTDPAFVREMAGLEGTLKEGEDGKQYTNLGKKPAKPALKPRGKRTKGKRSFTDSSGEESESDDSAAEALRRKKKKKASASSPKAAAKKEEKAEEQKHFEMHIAPLLRPFNFSVFRLIQQPPSSYLVSTAEAVSQQREQRKRKGMREADDAQRSKNKKAKLGSTNRDGGEDVDEQKESAQPMSDGEDRDAPAFLSHSLSQASSAVTLSASSLLFLLLDLLEKMRPVLSRTASHLPFFASASPSVKRAASSLQHVVHSPASLLTDLLPVLSSLHTHFTVLNTFLQTSDVDDDDDVDRSELMECMLAIIAVVRTIVLSRALRARSCQPLVHQALRALLGQEMEGAARTPLKSVCESMFELLRTSLTSLNSLDDAVAVVTVMHALLNYSSDVESGAEPSDQHHNQLSVLARGLLDVEWTKPSAPKKANLGRLVSLYVHHAPQPVQLVAELSDHVRRVCDDEDIADDEERFRASLTKKTAPLFIGPLMDETLLLLRATLVKAQHRSEKYLQRLTSIIGSMHSLLRCMRAFPTMSSLHSTALKAGRRLVDRCTKLLPSLAVYFKDAAWQERVQTVMRAVQSVTRLMRQLLAHGKERQERAIIRITPAVVKSLDAFIFAVKAVLKAVGLTNVFTQGQLKHKGLDGEFIPTQPSQRAKAERHADDGEEEEAERRGSVASLRRGRREPKVTKRAERSDEERGESDASANDQDDDSEVEVDGGSDSD